MLYVYDMPMTGKKITKFERFGANFTLENKTKKGNQIFYLFSCPGQEKILVVPFFVEQFNVLQEYVKKLPKAKKYESYKKLFVDELKMTVVDEDNYPSEESSTGSMEILIMDYKDIEVTFNYYDKKLILLNEFIIKSNNVFGNDVRVDLNKDED